MTMTDSELKSKCFTILADNGWATVFKTTCEWVFYIQKE